MSDFYKREIVVTKDGSSSIYLPAFDEHYHSVHGAVQESKHVFMKMGWEPVASKQEEISILEIGFGTGLNAFLVLEQALLFPGKKVHYASLEAFPVAEEQAGLLNYAEQNREHFLRLHASGWEKPVAILPNFQLEKRKITLQEFMPEESHYDLVFFDAFAPRVQPELWTEEVFRKMHKALKPGGILVTYCSKGDVRRAMIAAGLSVEKLPGPPGKREMLRAAKA
jgi:tRNA U34 5-methylaminomethyl-2-thiouridine-forming methyltransferase MnmC